MSAVAHNEIAGNWPLGQRVLKLAEVMAKIGMSKSTIYFLVSQGAFPSQIKLTDRKSGWLLSEIEQWIEQKRLQRDAAKEA